MKKRQSLFLSFSGSYLDSLLNKIPAGELGELFLTGFSLTYDKRHTKIKHISFSYPCPHNIPYHMMRSISLHSISMSMRYRHTISFVQYGRPINHTQYTFNYHHIITSRLTYSYWYSEV